jgi:hypothetical protein
MDPLTVCGEPPLHHALPSHFHSDQTNLTGSRKTHTLYSFIMLHEGRPSAVLRCLRSQSVPVRPSSRSSQSTQKKRMAIFQRRQHGVRGAFDKMRRATRRFTEFCDRTIGVQNDDGGKTVMRELRRFLTVGCSGTHEARSRDLIWSSASCVARRAAILSPTANPIQLCGRGKVDHPRLAAAHAAAGSDAHFDAAVSVRAPGRRVSHPAGQRLSVRTPSDGRKRSFK